MRSRWLIYHLKAHSKWDLMNRKKLYLIKMTANYDHVRKVLLIAKNTLIDFNWLFASATPQSDYFGYFASFQRCFSHMSAKTSEIQNLYFALCLVPPLDREKSKSEFRILNQVWAQGRIRDGNARVQCAKTGKNLRGSHSFCKNLRGSLSREIQTSFNCWCEI